MIPASVLDPYKPRPLKAAVDTNETRRAEAMLRAHNDMEAYIRANKPVHLPRLVLKSGFETQQVIPVGVGNTELSAASVAIFKAIYDSGLRPPANIAADKMGAWITRELTTSD